MPEKTDHASEDKRPHPIRNKTTCGFSASRSWEVVGAT